MHAHELNVTMQTNSTIDTAPESVIKEIVGFVVSNYPSGYSATTLPTGESLVDLGVVDSAGVIELIIFLEDKWNIQILDTDITKERIGSIEKMAAVVCEYLADK